MADLDGGFSDVSSLHIGRTVISANWERTEDERKVVKVLEEVAAQVGAKTVQAGETHMTYIHTRTD